MERQARNLRGDVPQGNVEAGNGKHRDAVAAEQMQVALDLFHEGANSGRIGDFEAAHLRRDHLVDGSAGGAWTDIAEGVAPAGEPAIG